MPIVQSLMDSLVKRYGKGKAESIYYGMEAGGTGPFAPGKKYRQLHLDFAARNGVPAIEDRGPGKKKGRRPRGHRPHHR